LLHRTIEHPPLDDESRRSGPAYEAETRRRAICSKALALKSFGMSPISPSLPGTRKWVTRVTISEELSVTASTLAADPSKTNVPVGPLSRSARPSICTLTPVTGRPVSTLIVLKLTRTAGVGVGVGAGVGPADGVADGPTGDAVGSLPPPQPAAISTESGTTRANPDLRIRRVTERTSGQLGLGSS
jgi:hypothetical protein